MKIENFSVRELTSEEQIRINGGGFFADVWGAICTAAKWIWENVTFSVENQTGDYTWKAST